MKKLTFFSVALAAALFGSTAFGADGDVLVADFDGLDYDGWTVEGTAFGDAPAPGTLPGQMDVSGFDGPGLANSFVGGDAATGTLTSPEVVLSQPFVNFLIGGGGHSGTRFELVVDGEVVRTERGPNLVAGGSEALDWATWDVADLQGKKAVFRIVDEETGGWGHLNVDRIVLSAKKRAGIEFTREISVEKRFLLIPIQTGAPTRWVRVEVDGKVEREFLAELADANVAPSFWGTLDARHWIGQTVKFVVEKADEDATFAPIRQSEAVDGGEPCYAEKYRPQFHFSPRRGWTNDPNGLVFYNGRYHLFYQHNPYGVKWNNMTWGHATSPDLLHWTEGPDALEPDPLGSIFSGSAAVDRENSSGFQTDPNGLPPLVCMFTYNGPSMRYGAPASQGLAYSLDDGKTFVKFEGNPTIPHIVGGNRDPKIFWHNETNRWICALYMDGEDYALFSSENLKSWTKICDIKNLGCSECPDMFPLAVDGDASNVFWVFWGGNGKYLLGDFDGTNFVRKAGPFDAKWGGADYAAQSYSDAPNGRRIQFSWANGGSYPEMPFNQQFSVPRELTLRTTSDGVRLCVNPVEELKTLRGDKLELKPTPTPNVPNAVDFVPANGAKSAAFDLLDAEIVVEPGDAKTLTVSLRGQKIALDFEANAMRYADVVAPLAVVDGAVKLRLVLDRTSLEIFANDGTSQITKCFVPADENDAPVLAVRFDGPQAESRRFSFAVYPIESVWNGNAER